MYPVHEDMILDDAAGERVRAYIEETGFGFPGTGPDDYEILPVARYLGWNFTREDLDAFAVGLRCLRPDMSRRHTFIRMSRGQLTREPDAKVLELNEPVLATDTLRMRRWRDTKTGPSRTGVDSYATEDGSEPGVDLDLRMLHDTLADVRRFAEAGGGPTTEGQRDLGVDFGLLLAGRYPRLKYLEKEGRLRADQLESLHAFDADFAGMTDTLRALALPTVEDHRRPEKRRHAEHNDR